MVLKTVKVKDILAYLGDDVLTVFGSVADRVIDNITDMARVNERSLDWINPDKEDKQTLAEQSKSKVLLVDSSIIYSAALRQQDKVLIVTSNPKYSLARIGNEFFVEKAIPSIHPTAIVSKDARIGANVYIGPYCVIGDASIGDDCFIDSNVRIYDGVIIGARCNVKAGAVLGGSGFGFERDKEGNQFRFPQIGGVVVGDDVEIGANTCIDRGALSDTIIGDHTKINNLCHIAHNNRIGRNVTITGCVNISGSSIVEDNVWIAPNVSLRGFVHLHRGCVVGTGAVVTKDIPENETWVGNPAKKLEKR